MRACNCPNCNAHLAFRDEARDFAFCQYCGTKIMLDDYRSTQRIVDEAKLKQAENERIFRLKELELETARLHQKNSSRQTLTKVWLAISLLILAICIFQLITEYTPVNAMATFMFIGFPIIGGGAYLIFKVIPGRDSEKIRKAELILNGGIEFPDSLSPFSEQSYLVVEQTLLTAGFRNVKCVNMHDLILGIRQKPGSVESISVNGKRISSGGEIYLRDTPIVITYHGLQEDLY